MKRELKELVDDTAYLWSQASLNLMKRELKGRVSYALPPGLLGGNLMKRELKGEGGEVHLDALL